MKFAKVFDTEDGGQVLVTKEFADDSYELKVRSDNDGVATSMSFGFEEEKDLEEAFDGYGQDQAESIRKNLVEITS